MKYDDKYNIELKRFLDTTEKDFRRSRAFTWCLRGLLTGFVFIFSYLIIRIFFYLDLHPVFITAVPVILSLCGGIVGYYWPLPVRKMISETDERANLKEKLITYYQFDQQEERNIYLELLEEELINRIRSLRNVHFFTINWQPEISYLGIILIIIIFFSIWVDFRGIYVTSGAGSKTTTSQVLNVNQKDLTSIEGKDREKPVSSEDRITSVGNLSDMEKDNNLNTGSEGEGSEGEQGKEAGDSQTLKRDSEENPTSSNREEDDYDQGYNQGTGEGNLNQDWSGENYNENEPQLGEKRQFRNLMRPEEFNEERPPGEEDQYQDWYLGKKDQENNEENKDNDNDNDNEKKEDNNKDDEEDKRGNTIIGEIDPDQDKEDQDQDEDKKEDNKGPAIITEGEGEDQNNSMAKRNQPTNEPDQDLSDRDEYTRKKDEYEESKLKSRTAEESYLKRYLEEMFKPDKNIEEEEEYENDMAYRRFIINSMADENIPANYRNLVKDYFSIITKE